MPIVPDTKDWSWVLQRRCDQCGFDSTALAFDAVPALVRATTAKWSIILGRTGAGQRPDENTWSPVEYAAHTRDVCGLFGERLAMVLNDDEPVFPDWDQDAAAIDGRYNEQDPAVVSGELSAAADATADAFATVPAASRGRKGKRSDGTVFTVDTLARYFAHDLVHHLHDVAPHSS